MITQQTEQLNLSQEIKGTLKSQKRSLSWLADNTGMYYKTLWDRLNRDGFKSEYELLKIAKLLNIDLNELRDRI